MSNIHYDFNNQDANREYPIKPKDAYDIKKAKEKIEEEQALQKKAVEKGNNIHKFWEKEIEFWEKEYEKSDPSLNFEPVKKLKATTINDKTITYTHCIPSSIDLVEFTLKQRLKILLGIKVNATINTYLKDGRIELTILKINE